MFGSDQHRQHEKKTHLYKNLVRRRFGEWELDDVDDVDVTMLGRDNGLDR